ncbi:winged helix-turn-helix domain-containing protein [Pseudoalteromonas sp. SSM20]|uniref:winged helix-turn-helix domain-containing protein n=1 Tax=Pseudoalteromonas sp. SSM20 TaxID=3139394 RepID=UPI003BA9BAA1
MAEQYWIGGFFIDLPRNQITHNGQTITLAPKALAVLTCLAEQQGQVVSQDTLLETVWPNSVVSPNTLQRSIAQLRKALGDDGKGQQFIKTHAKKGYSLECSVQWQNQITKTEPQAESESTSLNNENKHSSSQSEYLQSEPLEQNETLTSSVTAENTNSHNTFSPWLVALLTSVLMLTIGFITYREMTNTAQSPLVVEQMRALTATEHKESSGIYSPDGKYIVFHRFSDEKCVNNIWAKDIENQQEFQLTQNLDLYGSQSFSEDGKTLSFVQSVDCSQPITQKKCYRLLTIDFDAALKSPQTPTELIQCKNTEIRTPKWLGNSHIALMQKKQNRWQLIKYSVAEDKSELLYEVSDGNIVYYDYSEALGLFAVTTIHADGHDYIDLLSKDGALLSSNRIIKPTSIAKYRLIYPRFSPYKEQLVFSTGRQFYTLSYDGNVAKINIPLDEPMGFPTFNPNGDRILMIKGYYDSDIVVKNLQAETDEVISKTTLAEDSGLFQPNGTLIAYKSERSGDDQIWLNNQNSNHQLSQFPMDTYIYGLKWANDGNKLLVNANDELTLLSIEGVHTKINFSHPVQRLFGWNSDTNLALANIRIKGSIKLAMLNLDANSFEIISEEAALWAALTKQGQTIYLDKMERFWLSTSTEYITIPTLNSQGSDRFGFIVKNNVLYGVNDNLELWAYSLADESFQVLNILPTNLDSIDDINAGKLLMTLRKFSKKEVTELILAKN